MPTTLNLTVNIPDAKLANATAALRLRYTTQAVPVPTLAQLRTAFEQEVRKMAANWLDEYERALENAARTPTSFD